MKKKSLLGIIALIMVIALALTGCGQQGEQNAGATGSEGQNEAVGNGESVDGEDGEIMAEPEDDADVSGDNRQPEMRDGYYVYEVLGEEFLLKTNVWDYIDEDAKTFDFVGMAESLELGARNGPYFNGNRALSAPYFVGGDEICFLINVCTDETCTKVDYKVEYTIKYSADSSVSREYSLKGSSNYGLTFDLIVLATYGCEHLKENLSDVPLGDHLTEYLGELYNEQTFVYELP